ncbi:MAG: glycosyltransferase family 2 protein [Desulfobulbaceae bacterium]|nr:glycosyltransferase family 2 protein [Desulfobulbaceae bacterium]
MVTSDQPENFSISIIIPTRNGAATLGSVLAGLSRQTIPVLETLVIDSSSDDDTVEIAKKFGISVSVVPRVEFDHAGTRTMAARMATGDILVFMTQDAVPVDATALANLVAPLVDPRVAAAYGRQLPAPGATCFARHLRAFNYPERSSIRCWQDRQRLGFKAAFTSNSFAAYRRKPLKAAGYFGERMLFGEDTFTVAKLLRNGYCVAYAADAHVWHSHNYSLMQDFRRYFDIGVVHAAHREVLDSFGGSMGEGRRYVLSELQFFVRNGNYLRLPESIMRNGMKFLAYILGKRSDLLPRFLAAACSMNRTWWKNK